MNPERGVWRLTRVGVFACVALFLSVAGHVLGQGAIPGPAALTLVGILTLLASVVLTSTRATGRRIALVLAGLQALSHLVFHHVVGVGPAVLVAGHGGHLHAVRPQDVTQLAAHAAHTAHTGMPEAVGLAAHGVTAPMVAAHLLATLVTTWVMAAGEEYLHRTATRLVTFLLPPAPPAPAPAVGSLVHVIPLASREVGLGISLRGPPRLAT